MRPIRSRGALVLALLGALLGFGVTQAWQTRQAADPTGPADVAGVLGRWLQLAPRQLEQLRHVDPAYSEERQRLEVALAGERERLAQLFEQNVAGDEQILAQVERVIEAHDALERRVARFLLALRPHLTADQAHRLFERCASGVREAGGWRWRHGQSAASEQPRRRGGPPEGRGPARGRERGNDARWAPPTASRPAPPSSGETP